MLRELDVLQSPPRKRPCRPWEEAKAERRRLARTDGVQPSLPLVIGVGTKASRPLRLAVVALVELVGYEAISTNGEAHDLQSKALGSIGVVLGVVWRLGRQWPVSPAVVLTSSEVTTWSTMVGFASVDLPTTCADSTPVFRDNNQRAIVGAHQVNAILVAALSSGCIVSALDLCKAGSHARKPLFSEDSHIIHVSWCHMCVCVCVDVPDSSQERPLLADSDPCLVVLHGVALRTAVNLAINGVVKATVLG